MRREPVGEEQSGESGFCGDLRHLRSDAGNVGKSSRFPRIPEKLFAESASAEKVPDEGLAGSQLSVENGAHGNDFEASLRFEFPEFAGLFRIGIGEIFEKVHGFDHEMEVAVFFQKPQCVLDDFRASRETLFPGAGPEEVQVCERYDENCFFPHVCSLVFWFPEIRYAGKKDFANFRLLLLSL